MIPDRSFATLENVDRLIPYLLRNGTEHWASGGMAYTLRLERSAERLGGSSPSWPTKYCADGGIGIHSVLKSRRRKDCGIVAHSAHQKFIYSKVGHRVPNTDSGWFDSLSPGGAAVLQATVA